MQCCPLSNDGESASFSVTTQPVARRAHKCTECREEIAPGAKYERVTGKWDGYMATFKTCLSCVEIRNHFGCEGWTFGTLWEDMENGFFPDMKAGGPCMDGLSPAAKGRLFERREEWLLNR